MSTLVTRESIPSPTRVLEVVTFIVKRTTRHDQARRNHPSYQGGIQMSGKLDKAKGKLKQAVGDLTDDDDLRREGQIDELAGKAKEAIDKVKDKITPDRI